MTDPLKRPILQTECANIHFNKSNATIQTSSKIILTVKKIISLIKNVLYINWYDQITDKIILGRIPKKTKHINELKNKQVCAMLSIVEDHEMKNKESFKNKKVGNEGDKIERFTINGISCMQIKIKDHTTPTIKEVKKAMKFIKEQLKMPNKKVYVHCKAGCGRSATFVAAYLMKYGEMNPIEAQNAITNKRIINTLYKKNKQEFLRKYHKYLRKEKVKL